MLHRKSRYLYVLLVLSALVASPAVAADVRVGNSLTGPNSENTNTVASDTVTTVTIDTTTDVTNDVTMDLNTGGNTVSNNTVVEDVRTGDIRANAEVRNDVVAPSITVGSVSSSNEVVTATNHLTGPNSINTNNVTNTHATDVAISNSSTVANTVAIVAETGCNDISNNTIVGDVRTGDIAATVSLVNIARQQPIVIGVPSPSPVVSVPVPTSPQVVVPAPSSTPIAVAPGVGGAEVDMVPAGLGGVGGAFFPSGSPLSLLPLLAGGVAALTLAIKKRRQSA